MEIEIGKEYVRYSNFPEGGVRLHFSGQSYLVTVTDIDEMGIWVCPSSNPLRNKHNSWVTKEELMTKECARAAMTEVLEYVNDITRRNAWPESLIYTQDQISNIVERI